MVRVGFDRRGAGEVSDLATIDPWKPPTRRKAFFLFFCGLWSLEVCFVFLCLVFCIFVLLLYCCPGGAGTYVFGSSRAMRTPDASHKFKTREEIVVCGRGRPAKAS